MIIVDIYNNIFNFRSKITKELLGYYFLNKNYPLEVNL